MRDLEDLAEKEPSEVAITLSSSPGLQQLLEEPTMGHELIQLLCRVLGKAVGSRSDRRIVQHLAGVVKDSSFLRVVLPHYIVGMVSDPLPGRRAQYPQHLENIVGLLSDVLSIFPASAVRVTSMAVALLKLSVNGLRASGVDIPDRVVQNLDKIEGLITHLQEKARDGTLRSDNYTFLAPEEDAPPGEGDFRTLTIYPTPEEIHQDQKPFLRPNNVSCSYASGQVYLDTHFRLLREDFVRPLREGIRELLRTYQEQDLGQVPVRRKRFDDIRVYFDTRLLVPLCTPTGIAYKVQFDPSPLKFVRWQNSKRLLYGSLVCLSRDNFETFLFATVSDRDPAELQKGLVQLSFSQGSRPALAGVQVSDSFLMVETTAYFEAYRHVLEGLQEQEVEDLPFQRYIVECQTDLGPPAYLNFGDEYNLASIAAQGFEGEIQPFSVQNSQAWPPMEHLGLDESQMRALKLALTKEFAIIQGPPGTGKTYVGLKIAQALLTNSDVWQDDDVNQPVLVVCYTNHALDQFLEGIHSFLQDGIVRVGGRSNSEVLKRFTLRELTGGQGFRRGLPAHLRRAHFEISTELAQAEQKIVQQASQLECSLRGVLHEQFLERFIAEEHWDSLSNQPMWDGFQPYGVKQSMIVEWLGLGSSEFQQREREPNAENAEEEDEEPEAEDEDGLVDVEEEADLIQRERMIDDAEMNGRGEKKRKSKTDTAVKALEEMMLALSLNQSQRDPGISADGWEMQKAQKKKMNRRIRRELVKSSTMSEEEEDAVFDVWTLPVRDRWRLYRLWLQRYRTDMRTRALQSEQAYQNAADRLAEIRVRQDLCVLKEARVIGMTTTGAAKYRRALQEIQPRLVIVEEAAEVLEAHTITTLSRACQHLILIGDHQQLRPSATVYELAKNFNLEVSLFERLVKLDFPFVRLNYQHRMRPEIARLLTPHIYSELENHPSVLEYENIKVSLVFSPTCSLWSTSSQRKRSTMDVVIRTGTRRSFWWPCAAISCVRITSHLRSPSSPPIQASYTASASCSQPRSLQGSKFTWWTSTRVRRMISSCCLLCAATQKAGSASSRSPTVCVWRCPAQRKACTAWGTWRCLAGSNYGAEFCTRSARTARWGMRCPCAARTTQVPEPWLPVLRTSGRLLKGAAPCPASSGWTAATSAPVPVTPMMPTTRSLSAASPARRSSATSGTAAPACATSSVATAESVWRRSCPDVPTSRWCPASRTRATVCARSPARRS
ncbi:hypothetical protein GJAV_G00182490 [Gymnothorax javanicus]|nr:hypothetical protein GJAV_G00182490 [Gymnothorax javanicus]